MTITRLHSFVATAGLLLFGLASPASAQTFGARVGVSADPTQFYFGGHVETPPVVDQLRFRPNLEIGLGDGVTLVGLNFEFAYHFPKRNGWNLYAGGGPALNVLSADRGDTGAQGGFNLLAGMQHEGGLFVEVKAGLIDSPGFKFGVGYVFHRR